MRRCLSKTLPCTCTFTGLILELEKDVSVYMSETSFCVIEKLIRQLYPVLLSYSSEQ